MANAHDLLMAHRATMIGGLPYRRVAYIRSTGAKLRTGLKVGDFSASEGNGFTLDHRLASWPGRYSALLGSIYHSENHNVVRLITTHINDYRMYANINQKTDKAAVPQPVPVGQRNVVEVRRDFDGSVYYLVNGQRGGSIKPQSGTNTDSDEITLWSMGAGPVLNGLEIYGFSATTDRGEMRLVPVLDEDGVGCFCDLADHFRLYRMSSSAFVVGE